MNTVAQNKKARPTTATKNDVTGMNAALVAAFVADAEGIFDEVWRQLADAALAFASADGATACGDYLAADDDDRTNFNIATAKLTDALRHMRRRIDELGEHAKASTPTMATLDAAAEE